MSCENYGKSFTFSDNSSQPPVGTVCIDYNQRNDQEIKSPAFDEIFSIA